MLLMASLMPPTHKKKYVLYGSWGPGRYLDGSGSKKRAKLRSRIQIWMVLARFPELAGIDRNHHKSEKIRKIIRYAILGLKTNLKSCI